MESLTGRTLSGRYRLEEQIGAGGMGQVWRAIDTVLDRQVAVKIMSLDAAHPDPTAVEREDICRRLEAAAKTDDFEDADGFLAGLRRRWTELPAIASTHAVSKRFERAAAPKVAHQQPYPGSSLSMRQTNRQHSAASQQIHV